MRRQPPPIVRAPSGRLAAAVGAACIVVAAFIASAAFAPPGEADPVTAHPQEGPRAAFLGESRFDLVGGHDGGRFPNVVVTREGTILTVFGDVEVRRSEDGGTTWGPPIRVADGFMGGGTIVDETDGDILVFVEVAHPPAPLTVYRSVDDGRTWDPFPVTIEPDEAGDVPSMHMNESGITLRHGPHAGRLVRAARHYAGSNDRPRWPAHRTTAIHSDDGGRTWRTSPPFAAGGTGEAAIVERSDGTLLYNTRAHWHADPDEPPLRRRVARSDDGGATWTDWRILEALPDGPQDSTYGCMAGLVRLPVTGHDILLYANCDSDRGRVRGTVWASFDGGATWPLKRLAHEGLFAYSSMATGRPGTPSEGLVYLHFETSGGSRVARFNLAWMLGGVPTGDGVVPAIDEGSPRTPRSVPSDATPLKDRPDARGG